MKKGGRNPSTPELVAFLEDKGLMYEWGTEVEELGFAARAYGYPGSTSFQDWSLEGLVEQLNKRNPVVVPLGERPGQPGHYVVLTGISSDGEWVIYNDPLTGKGGISLNAFLKKWKVQGNSGLIIK